MLPSDIEVDVSAVLLAIRNDIDVMQLCPRIGFDLDRTLLALTSKQIALAMAICHLVRAGFYGEAFGLSRSSVEAFLLVKFISNKDSEQRATSYLHFFKAHVANHEKVREQILGQKKQHTQLVQEWLHDAEKFPSRTSWQSAHNMALELYDDPRERDATSGKGYKGDIDYFGTYEHTSHFVHVCSLSLLPHLTWDGEPFRTFGGDTRDEDSGFLALYYGLAYSYMTCILSLRLFSCELSRAVRVDIERTLDRIREALPAERLMARKISEGTNPGASGIIRE